MIKAAPDEAEDGVMTTPVRKGDLQVTVTETGTLDSARNAILTCQVEGSTTIISIVPEGTFVKEGDIVCELDSSALVDRETTQKISLTQAEALLSQAQENVEIQKTQNESDVAAAELKLSLALLDLRKFEEGEFLQQVNELSGAVTLARENLSRAEESQAFVRRMAQKGYRSQNDLEAERIAVTKAEIDLKVAEEKLKVLKDFTYVRTLEELQANAKEFEREIQRVKRKSVAALSQKQAELSKCELTFKVEKDKYERIVKQIEACTIRAPQDGQVVWANARDPRRSDAPVIEEGAVVRERQAIINLPDYDAMKVNARIHESRISLIKTGLPVRVRIDAYAGEVFGGVVDTVSSVPLSNSSFSRGDVKEYEASVRLTDAVEKVNKLRPGLSANIEIIVAELSDVLLAPVQAIVTIGRDQYAWVRSGDKYERRTVKIGRTNERQIEIKEGLTDGEKVVMNPRTLFAKEVGQLENELAKKEAEQSAEGGPRRPGGPRGMGGERRGPGGPEGADGSSPMIPGGPGLPGQRGAGERGSGQPGMGPTSAGESGRPQGGRPDASQFDADRARPRNEGTAGTRGPADFPVETKPAEPGAKSSENRQAPALPLPAATK